MFHNSWNQNIFAVANAVDFKFCSFHVFVNQNRICNSLRKDNFHVFLDVGICPRNNHILSAKNITWTHQNRVGKAGGCFQSFNFRKDSLAFRTVYVQSLAKFFKTFPVFCKVNSVCACSENADSLAVEVFCKFDGSLSAECNYNTDRLFNLDYIHNVDRSERFKIKTVCSVKVCRNSFRIVVYDCNFVAELFERPYALNRGIVEFNSLSDSDWPGTQDNNRSFFAAFAFFFKPFKKFFSLVFSASCRIKIRRFCAELAGAGVYHFERSWSVEHWSMDGRCGIFNGFFFGFGNIFELVQKPFINFCNFMDFVHAHYFAF